MTEDVPIPCPTSPRELGKPLKLQRIFLGHCGHDQIGSVAQLRTMPDAKPLKRRAA
jgi:hypothetical protein